eukprot:TRINITY_DN322_c0_g2_i4.p1 TRINITY_DN322_c0_g2~~TRINITY_DN322_c0_g2_i4.p1  ORF type:complete len:371 (+),score=128.00 TRINITY_DN322_c0_g2_i4:207-1319(+)
MEERTIILKLVYDSTLKRIRRRPKNFKELRKLISLEFPDLSGKAIRIQYVDCDGDTVTVTTKEDFKEAYEQLNERSERTLKLTISVGSGKEQTSAGEDSKLSWDALMKSLVVEEIDHQNEAINKLVHQEALKSSIAEKESLAVHEGVKCNNCGMKPIKGVRYKCSQCGGYNLCGVCEATEVHGHHALLKLAKPVEKNLKKAKSRVAREKKTAKEPKAAATNKESTSNKKEILEKKAVETKNSELMGVITDTDTKELCGAPGDLGIVQMTFKNLSEVAWPADTVMAKVDGKIPFESILLPDKLEPGREMKLSIPIELPWKLGSYKIKLRLKGNNKFFGQTVLVAVDVHKESNTTCKKCKERAKEVYSTDFA